MGLIIALGTVACETAPARSTSRGGTATWPYEPVAVRVHPLSRITRTDDALRGVLDLRIEASDADGIESRAIGSLRIRFVSRGRTATAVGEHDWRIDLSDPALNRRHYDAVTRTYHVRQEIEWTSPPAPGAVLEVTVAIERPGHRTLRATKQFRWE